MTNDFAMLRFHLPRPEELPPRTDEQLLRMVSARRVSRIVPWEWDRAHGIIGSLIYLDNKEEHAARETPEELEQQLRELGATP